MTPGKPVALAGEFRARTGREPAGVWSAPGRVNLIGEHTDYNQGFVLPIAINRRTYVAAAPRSDRILRGWSLQQDAALQVAIPELAPRSLGGWASYACGPAWVLSGMGWELGGADLLVDSQVPVGAGLSSSAAIQTAIALALADLQGRALAGTDLAMVAHRSESEFVGVPVGIMDQMVSALGRRSSALFLDTRDVSYDHVPFDPADAGLALAVIDTRVKHSLQEGQYAERRQTCEAAAAALRVPSLREATLQQLDSVDLTGIQRRRARHVVSENARVLQAVSALRDRDFSRLGSAFVGSHESLREDYEVSSPELDLAVETALARGALGARMTGGGFGGSAIALIDSGRVGGLEADLTAAFRGAGHGDPQVFCVTADDGAAAYRWA